MIHISKQDVVNIEGFKFKNDFSGINFIGKSKINLSKLKTISKYLQYKKYRKRLRINAALLRLRFNFTAGASRPMILMYFICR